MKNLFLCFLIVNFFLGSNLISMNIRKNIRSTLSNQIYFLRANESKKLSKEEKELFKEINTYMNKYCSDFESLRHYKASKKLYHLIDNEDQIFIVESKKEKIKLKKYYDLKFSIFSEYEYCTSREKFSSLISSFFKEKLKKINEITIRELKYLINLENFINSKKNSALNKLLNIEKGFIEILKKNKNTLIDMLFEELGNLKFNGIFYSYDETLEKFKMFILSVIEYYKIFLKKLEKSIELKSFLIGTRKYEGRDFSSISVVGTWFAKPFYEISVKFRIPVELYECFF